jgi:hypothetical protein
VKFGLTQREEYRLRVLENSVLKRIFISEREEVVQAGEDCVMNNFTTCEPHNIVLG